MTSDDDSHYGVQVFNVLRGEASQIRSTPFGDVGTVFSGRGIEVVWVSKLDEPVDEDWFSSEDIDLILVIQGQLKFQFESASLPDRVLGVGEALVLAAGTRCRAYRWPRDASDATVFVAAYPTSPVQAATGTVNNAGGNVDARLLRHCPGRRPHLPPPLDRHFRSPAANHCSCDCW